jgi:hypothetical protein
MTKACTWRLVGLLCSREPTCRALEAIGLESKQLVEAATVMLSVALQT